MNQVANQFKMRLAAKQIDCTVDTFKVVLTKPGFVFSKQYTRKYNQGTAVTEKFDPAVDELATGNGYTQGGSACSTVALTEDVVNSKAVITLTHGGWTAATNPLGPVNGALIFDDTDGVDSVVGWIDFNGNVTVEVGGILKLSNPILKF